MSFINETGLAKLWGNISAGFIKPTEVTLETRDTANVGYIKTYDIKVKGTSIGAIDIPKDYLLKGADIKTATIIDTPLAGLVVGDKYIDFDVNVNDGSGTSSHIYIKVSDLAKTYIEGNGIDINGSNTVSVVIDSSSSNGLSVSANGVALALATTTVAGAMSASDKTKLDGLVPITDAEIDAICI